MDKASVRKKYREQRRSLPSTTIKTMSRLVHVRAMEFLSARPFIKHVHIFLPIRKLNEIDTFQLLFDMQRAGYRVYTSGIGVDAESLDTYDISDCETFDQDAWDIPVPKIKKKVVPDPIQLVFVPLLAFDKRGYRLGYGKGYYDRFLAGLGENTLKVGLSFFQPEELLPVDDHDIPMDVGITPDGTLIFPIP